MSKYTVELRYVVESGFDLQLDEYPIFDESYREVLNKKIIDRYFFREIGFDTAAKFRHYLKTRLNEIMPFYNKLYLSEIIDIEPLTRLDYTESYDSEKDHDSSRSSSVEGEVENIANQNNTSKSERDNTSSSNMNSKGESVSSDTPSTKLDWSTLENEFYASKVDIGKNEATDSSTSGEVVDAVGSLNSLQNTASKNTAEDTAKIKDMENYVKRILGNNASRTDSEMLTGFRSTFLNIDVDIIENLEDLFILIY